MSTRYDWSRGLYKRGDRTMPVNVHRECTWVPTTGEGSVTSRYGGTDRDEHCRKTIIDITRSRRQDLIGREDYTKGATEQCRKTSIDNTRSGRHDPIDREGKQKGRPNNSREKRIDNTRSERHDLIGRGVNKSIINNHV